jgi:hypothetical protein
MELRELESKATAFSRFESSLPDHSQDLKNKLFKSIFASRKVAAMFAARS